MGNSCLNCAQAVDTAADVACLPCPTGLHCYLCTACLDSLLQGSATIQCTICGTWHRVEDLKAARQCLTPDTLNYWQTPYTAAKRQCLQNKYPRGLHHFSPPPPVNLRHTPCLPLPVFLVDDTPLEEPTETDRLATAVYDHTDDILPQNTGELLLEAVEQSPPPNETANQKWIQEVVEQHIMTVRTQDSVPESWPRSPGREFLLALQYAHLFASLAEDRDPGTGAGLRRGSTGA